MKALARIDFFRKVPEELQVNSGSGLVFTVLSFLTMIALVVSHYNAYMAQSTRTYVSLDSHQEDQLRINFNVSLVAVPCQHASVDLSDHMGQRFVNITRHIRHFKLASSKSTHALARLDEVVIDAKTPSWGGVARATHDGVHYSTPLTTRNFFDFMAKYELVLVNYYAPWCPFCQQLNPEWERAAAQLQDHPEYSERVTMASVDCTDSAAAYLCQRANIRAYPSMLIYMYGSTHTRFIYNGPRKSEYLLQFLDLFYRRLEPDADFAEEVHADETLSLPMNVNHENVAALPLQKVKRTLPPDAVEGCEVSGSISVNRVPGKLVFTARSADHSFALKDINVTHHVNHFSFGQIRASEHLLDGARGGGGGAVLPSRRFPLDSARFFAENVNITIEHFLNVVGFDHADHREYIFDRVPRTYEFSASSNQYNASDSLPSALFTFDISPLVVLVVKDNVPLYRFLTSLCAVVGGVFTVIGLVDSGVFHAMNSIKKKQQLGKLA